MGLVVVSIEGVLTVDPPTGNSLNYEAAVLGRSFYDMVREGSRLLLLSSDRSKGRAKAWLMREHFTRYADLHCYPADELRSYSDWKAQHVIDLLGIGHHVSMYIDSDIEAIRKVLDGGVATMLVTYPSRLPGRQVNEQAYSPWYDLVESIEHESVLKAAKALEGSRE